MRCSLPAAVTAIVACLLSASAGRADVVFIELEVDQLPGFVLSARAPIDVAPNDVRAYPGFIRIVDTNTGAVYRDFARAQYGGEDDVWFSTMTFYPGRGQGGISVNLHVLPDGSYELGWWDLAADES